VDNLLLDRPTLEPEVSLPTPQELEAIYRLGGVRGSWRLNWNGTIHALCVSHSLDWFDHGHRTKAICGTPVHQINGMYGFVRKTANVEKVCRRCARIGKLPT